MIYVADARAIAEMFSIRPAPDFHVGLTDLVQAGHLTFPTDAVTELREHYPGDPAEIWATAVKGSRVHAAVPFGVRQRVLRAFPDLVDVNTPREPVAVAVLAQAQILGEAQPVTVVTEDLGGRPGRMTLEEACVDDQMTYLPTEQFLQAVGL